MVRQLLHLDQRVHSTAPRCARLVLALALGLCALLAASSRAPLSGGTARVLAAGQAPPRFLAAQPVDCASGFGVVLSLDGGSSMLNAIVAIAGDDVWAAGEADGSAWAPLIERWDGTAWHIVPGPALLYNQILGLAAVSANDIWAVGRGLSGPGQIGPLIEHWNGTAWSVVPAPSNGILYAVTALSATDVWAVGQVNFTGPLAEHWDGTTWSVVPTPQLGGGQLLGITAVAPDDIWAVGTTGARTLVEHWDGQRWGLVASPNPDPLSNGLVGVTAVSADDI